MSLAIESIGPGRLGEYARIPMVSEVSSILSLQERDGGLGGFHLHEEAVRPPYRKDHDAFQDGGPLCWPSRFDLSNWGIWIARVGLDPVGGTAVAWKTAGVEMLEGRDDLAVLWDIRVHPQRKREGIGTAVFRYAAAWAGSKGCSLLKIETQNTNVAACRFYAAVGCFLGQIDRMAYRQCPQAAHEVMLIWYLDLTKQQP